MLSLLSSDKSEQLLWKCLIHLVTSDQPFLSWWWVPARFSHHVGSGRARTPLVYDGYIVFTYHGGISHQVSYQTQLSASNCLRVVCVCVCGAYNCRYLARQVSGFTCFTCLRAWGTCRFLPIRQHLPTQDTGWNPQLSTLERAGAYKLIDHCSIREPQMKSAKILLLTSVIGFRETMLYGSATCTCTSTFNFN